MIVHPRLREKYPRLYVQAENRLGMAKNLCGLGDCRSIGKHETNLALNVTLAGGWTQGLLPLVRDIATFVERDSDFVNDYGNYHVAQLAKLMSDAIKAGDRKKIEAAIVALGGTFYE
jgi:hypothetical protein